MVSQADHHDAVPTRFKLVRARGFRNLGELALTPGEHFNVFHGDNGTGKSSILEALAYLASLRSFRDAPKDELIAQGVQEGHLLGQVAFEPLPREYRVSLSRTRARRVAIDGKRPRSLSAYFATIQRVVFNPADTELAVAGPDTRRTMLDRILEQVDPSYCQVFAEYTKALRSRNHLLKDAQPDRQSIMAYDELLCQRGAYIGRSRDELVRQLAPWVERNFAEITDDALPLEVRYAPRNEPLQEVLLHALQESLPKDLARGFTTVGPHGDDLRLAVSQTLVKHHASQGQHRALVLAFKVAELGVLARRTGRIPLLLLDDVSSELDRRRNRRFFTLLSRLGGQVFLTTTHPEFIQIDGAPRRDFHVEAGNVTPS